MFAQLIRISREEEGWIKVSDLPQAVKGEKDFRPQNETPEDWLSKMLDKRSLSIYILQVARKRHGVESRIHSNNRQAVISE